MPANPEIQMLLNVFGTFSKDFRTAVAEAAANIDSSEQALVAGLASRVASRQARPVDEFPSPFYVITDAGLHFGVLVRKGGMFSKGESHHVFVPRSEMVSINSDHQSAVDLLGANGDQVAFLWFSDGLGMQFVSTRPGPPAQYPALVQMQNALAALGFQL